MATGADLRHAAECYGDMDSYAMYTCLRTSLRISLRIHHNSTLSQTLAVILSVKMEVIIQIATAGAARIVWASIRVMARLPAVATAKISAA